MRLSLHILGTEVFAISTEPAEPDGAPDAMSTPVGFTASHGDQRWEKGVELE